ncbi:acyl-CoA dehydrogenase family protein [Amycolatopsis panacis]|uniref:Acyl-CoA dehydrogenase n=1 Tax=Amycolatopsis panacis TaxID=2340917 RepID=A0A419HZL3_9PSEU|nr:acyl-CoA dehydrogenase family protein [Amycolatopsis panacis]RJQ82698.1 acyl-CoA dehydrogenase [Amycolatopsis panacis]
MTPAADLAQVRARVRAFTGECLAAGDFVPRCDAWVSGFDLAFSKALGEQGLVGVTWPAEFGGAGMSSTARLVITEELLRVGAPVAAHWIGERQIGPSILRFGSRELQAEFLPAIMASDVSFCLGMSETEAGSDLAAVRTTARRDGSGWRITGAKVWTTNAHHATHAYVLARTSRGELKHEGLTEFIVDLKAPGVTVRPILDLAGEHHFNEMLFDEVAVPDRWVIGEVGEGWAQVTGQLSFERGGSERFLSTYPLLAETLGHAHRCGDRATIEQVGALAARVTALRSLAWDIAVSIDNGVAPVADAAKLKYLGPAFERDVLTTARYALDVGGPSDDGTLERLIAEAQVAVPGMSIRGGVSEVLLTLVARSETRS